MKIKHLEKTIDKMMKNGFLDWADKLRGINKQVEIYLVGGAVRDALLGIKDIKDYDFVILGIGLERLGKELEKLGRVNLVGKHFGVYKFIPKNKKLEAAYDIALPRTEISKAIGGYRDFDVKYDENLDIREDLGRRDFTVNAMAYDIFNKKLVDEFGGVKDLEDKIIRTVGNGYERFEEDYSRMLRAIRFACQLDFKIEEITWKAIKKLMAHINDTRGNKIHTNKIQNPRPPTRPPASSLAGEVGRVGWSLKATGGQAKSKIERIVPYESIASELLKAFVLNPLHAFDLYDKSGAFEHLTPEILKMKECPQPDNWHSEGDVWEHTRLCLKNLGSKTFAGRFDEPLIFLPKKQAAVNREQGFYYSAELVMALLWHDTGKPYTITTPEKDGTDRLRFNNHDVASAKIAKENFEKLKLSAAPEFDFDIEKAVWLISKHHLFDTKTINEMKNSTVEKYFFGERFSGENLLKMGFVDMSSSIRQDTGEGDVENFDMMLKRINELKKLGKDRKLPKALINGNGVMRILGIKPSKKVGKILGDLREKQLAGEIKTKQEAKQEIKKLKD
ncbi:MAG: HD domain-containing protein [Patescibacteria group bacterium]